jgi:RNA-directed DNA polymerase
VARDDRHAGHRNALSRHFRILTFKVLLVSLNESLAGWANYFRYGVCSEAFREVDYHAWGRIMRWLRRKYAGRTGLSLRKMRRRFCLPGTWIFAVDGVRFKGAGAVTSKEYRYRGSKIPTPWAPQTESAAKAA